MVVPYSTIVRITRGQRRKSSLVFYFSKPLGRNADFHPLTIRTSLRWGISQIIFRAEDSETICGKSARCLRGLVLRIATVLFLVFDHYRNSLIRNGTVLGSLEGDFRTCSARGTYQIYR